MAAQLAGLWLVSPVDRAAWVLCSTVIIVGVSIDFGAPDYVATFVAESDYKSARRMLLRCTVLSVVGSLVVAVAACTLLYEISPIRNEIGLRHGIELFILSGLAACIRSPILILSSYFLGVGRLNSRAITVLAQPILLVLLLLPLLFHFRRALCLPLASIASSLVALVLVPWRQVEAHQVVNEQGKQPIPGLISYSSTRFLVGSIGLAMTQGDRWLVAAAPKGAEILREVDFAQRLGQPSKLLAITLAGLATPLYGRARGSLSDLAAVYRRQQRGTLPACLVLALLAGVAVVSLIVSSHTGFRYIPLATLPLLSFVHGTTANATAVGVALGRTRFELEYSVVALLLAVVGSSVALLRFESAVPYIAPASLAIGSIYMLIRVRYVLVYKS
jgi:O-antigen/teichoic acid export membrane protein